MTEIAKQHAKLADGRDLFYFDDFDSKLPAHRNADSRELPERPEVAQMRLDSLTGEWVSVAAHRHGRAHLPPAHLCPLCPSTEENLSELPDNFDVAVFENKSPSFGPNLLATTDVTYSTVPNLALGSVRDSIGRCEVVVFSPEHLGSLGAMPTKRVRTVIEALADRTEHLQSLPGVMQVFPFENRGQDIGVTLHHPHGQIYAYPFITPRTTKLLDSISRYGNDLFADTLKFEQGSERELIKSDNFTAYVPFAGRWPIEIHLLPHRHVQNLAQLTADEKDELAEVYRKLLHALDEIYETPTPYISAWHQAPLVDAGKNVRLQLQITSPRRAADKLKYLAGSESAMGAFIADFPPETTAARLREVLG
jgi:UDPglucose--hexose-1-phosphate uridylyltransferase